MLCWARDEVFITVFFRRHSPQILDTFKFRQNILSVTLVFHLETEIFQEKVSAILCVGFCVGRG